MGCNVARECEIGPDALGDTAMLWKSIRERAEAVLEMRGQLGGVSRLCPPKEVVDDTLKLLITAKDGRRAAVIRWSSEVAPHGVAEETELARKAKELLGARLGAVVLDPLLTGEVGGRSFTMLPYCEPLKESRVRWLVQRLLLAPRILEWLRLATECTAREATEDQIESDFRLPLEFMMQNEQLGARIREEARRAVRLLDDGHWRPKYVLAHNDLWKGNILIRRGSGRDSPGEFRGVVVIDWGSAVLRGHAMYDLIRLAQSMRVRRGRIATEVRHHCRILGATSECAKAYLLAALGHIGMHLGHFPVERYNFCAQICCQVLFAEVSDECRRDC